MNYQLLNDKDFLQNLINDKEAFIEVFSKTHGFVLYKCEQLELDVPLETLRGVPNYLEYPHVINKIAQSPIPEEICKFLHTDVLNVFNFSQDMLFSDEFREKLKAANSPAYMNNWVKLLEKFPMKRELSLNEIVNFENELYTYFYSNTSFRNVDMFQRSLRYLDKSSLEKVDPRFSTLQCFSMFYNSIPVDYYGLEGIGLRSPIGVYFEEGAHSNPERLAQSHNKFKQEFIFKDIDNQIWFNDKKRVNFLTKLNNSLDIPSETSQSFYKLMKDNKDFHLFLIEEHPNSPVYKNTSGEVVTSQEILNSILNYSLSQLFFNSLDDLKLFTKNNNFDIRLVNNPHVSSVYHYLKETKLKDHKWTSNEFKAFFDNFESYDTQKIIKVIYEQLPSIINEKDPVRKSHFAKGFAKYIFKNGEYGINTFFSKIPDASLMVTFISSMPHSLNKHTLARAVLLKLKEEDNKMLFSEKDITDLKELMVVPEDLRAPLNKYIRRQNNNLSEDMRLTLADVEALRAYGDPDFNNVKDIATLSLCPDLIIRHTEDNGKPAFIDLDLVFEKYKSIDFNEKNTDNTQVYNDLKDTASYAVEQENPIDKDKLADFTAFYLKNVLSRIDIERSLDSDLDGVFYLNTNNVLSSGEKDFTPIEYYENGLSACMIFLDNHYLIRKMPLDEKDGFIKQIADKADLTEDEAFALSYISKYYDNVDLFKHTEIFEMDIKDKSIVKLSKYKDSLVLNRGLDKEIEKFTLCSNLEKLAVYSDIFGKDVLFNKLLDKKPGVAALLRDHVTDNPEFAISRNWDELKRFIVKESSQENNVFVRGDYVPAYFNLDSLSLLTDAIKYSFETDNKGDKPKNEIGDPQGFFKLLEEMKEESSLAYVVTLSDLNVREFCQSYNKFHNKTMSSSDIINSTIDVNKFADGVIELFQKRSDFETTIQMNNFFFMEYAIETIKCLDKENKTQLLKAISDKSYELDESLGGFIRNQLKSTFVDVSSLSSHELLEIITNAPFENQKKKKDDNYFISLLENLYELEGSSCEDKVDIFLYAKHITDVAKDLKFNINQSSKGEHNAVYGFSTLMKGEGVKSMAIAIKKSMQLSKAMSDIPEDLEESQEYTNTGNSTFKL